MTASASDWDDLVERLVAAATSWLAERRGAAPEAPAIAPVVTAEPAMSARRTLTKRQREGYDFVAAAPEGLSDLSLGVKLGVFEHAAHTLGQRMELAGWVRRRDRRWVAVNPSPEDEPSAESVREHLLTVHGVSAAVTRAVNRHAALHAGGQTHADAA